MSKYFPQITIDGETYYVKDIEAREELKNKADIDGAYDGLTAGTAYQLASTVMTEDKGAYTFRTSGGSVDIGNREQDKIIGGTVAWNQLANPNATSTTDLTYTVSNGELIVNGTTTSVNYKKLRATSIVNHVYMLAADHVLSATDGVYLFNDSGGVIVLYGKSAIIGKATAAKDFYVVFDSGKTYSNYKLTVQIIDLTLALGSTIANRLYALEQATAGAGVAWFKKYFPKKYYAYDAGSLQSVNAASHDMVGFNAWDEEWEVGNYDSDGSPITSSTKIRSKSTDPIPVIPNTAYCFSAGTSRVSVVYWYDASDTFISYTENSAAVGVITSPENAHYCRFKCADAYGTTYHNDICINLSWSGYRNGEYEPYKLSSYPLDSNLQLRGIPKIDTNDELYYDGDIYESSGKVTRKYGIVDIGTLSVTVYSGSQSIYRITVADKKTGLYNIRCSAYATSSSESKDTILNKEIIGIDLASGYVYFRDTAFQNYSIAEIQAAMSGVYLVYELATPTEETASPYAENQAVDDFGTERYVDASVLSNLRDVEIPVGHITKYMANLRDKLQHLPSTADADGTFIIKQTSHQMELQEFDPLNAITQPDTDNSTKIATTAFVQTAVNAEKIRAEAVEATKADKSYADYILLREEEDRQILMGSVAQMVEDTYSELRSSPIHTAITIGGSVYPRMDNTRMAIDRMLGRTVAFNQLLAKSALRATNSSSAVTATNNGDGSFTITGTANGTAYTFFYSANNIALNPSHIYLIPNTSAIDIKIAVSNNGSTSYRTATVARKGNIFTGYDSLAQLYAEIASGTAVSTTYYPQLIDLTQQYGSTTADAILAMETATPGAGVAYVRQRMPLDYYAYNTGTLTAPVVSGWSVTGKNLLDKMCDKESGYYDVDGIYHESTLGTFYTVPFIPVKPNTNYIMLVPNYLVFHQFYLYDSGKMWISRTSGTASETAPYYKTITTPANCAYIRLQGASQEIWDSTAAENRMMFAEGSTPPPYEPYALTSLTIPTTTLTGVGTAQDELLCVEVAENDYSLIKHSVMQETVFSNNTQWFAGYGGFYAYLPSSIKKVSEDVVPNIIMADYATAAYNQAANKTASLIPNDRFLLIKDSSLSSDTVTAALTGKNIVFEIATPTETTIAEHLTLAEVSAIVQNGGIIGIVNSNGDIIQPDAVFDTVCSKAAS